MPLTLKNFGAPLYTVVWENYDGTVLETDQDLSYGTTPTYDGETPTRPGDSQYEYTFSGWSPTVGPITGDTTYTAQYTGVVNQYTIKFVDWDGTQFSSATYNYGTPANSIVKPANPTRPSTPKYNYSFIKWEPTVSEVTGNQTYTALYAPILRNYTIRFIGDGGTVLQSNILFYGEMPSYTGATPTKSGYTFTGWSPTVGVVVGNQDYIAQFA